MLQKFFSLNKQLCRIITRFLPFQEDLFEAYDHQVAFYMNSKKEQLVADIGGGKKCTFAKYRDRSLNTKIITVDISKEEMEYNRDTDQKIVANVVDGLPFENEAIDMLVSRSVLEHLTDVEAFVRNARKALKKGGLFISVFPSKFALFSLINQMFSSKYSKRLSHFFFPEKKGECGFPAFYKKCYYTAIKSCLERNGFEILEIRVSYFQSPYFGFFAPFFLMSLCYEMIIRTLNIKNLAAYLMVTAKKI
ncbi:MAG: class I SAM-dependent methyltransferase [Firmicutes bacterium]|nr:class I SAM-dependent methyltransferase [Bacillota bacterium]